MRLAVVLLVTLLSVLLTVVDARRATASKINKFAGPHYSVQKACDVSAADLLKKRKEVDHLLIRCEGLSFKTPDCSTRWYATQELLDLSSRFQRCIENQAISFQTWASTQNYGWLEYYAQAANTSHAAVSSRKARLSARESADEAAVWSGVTLLNNNITHVQQHNYESITAQVAASNNNITKLQQASQQLLNSLVADSNNNITTLVRDSNISITQQQQQDNEFVNSEEDINNRAITTLIKVNNRDLSKKVSDDNNLVTEEVRTTVNRTNYIYNVTEELTRASLLSKLSDDNTTTYYTVAAEFFTARQTVTSNFNNNMNSVDTDLQTTREYALLLSTARPQFINTSTNERTDLSNVRDTVRTLSSAQSSITRNVTDTDATTQQTLDNAQETTTRNNVVSAQNNATVLALTQEHANTRATIIANATLETSLTQQSVLDGESLVKTESAAQRAANIAETRAQENTTQGTLNAQHAAAAASTQYAILASAADTQALEIQQQQSIRAQSAIAAQSQTAAVTAQVDPLSVTTNVNEGTTRRTMRQEEQATTDLFTQLQALKPPNLQQISDNIASDQAFYTLYFAHLHLCRSDSDPRVNFFFADDLLLSTAVIKNVLQYYTQKLGVSAMVSAQNFYAQGNNIVASNPRGAMTFFRQAYNAATAAAGPSSS